MPVPKEPSATPFPARHSWTHIGTKEVPIRQMQVLDAISCQVRVCSHAPPLQRAWSLWDDPLASLWVFISHSVFSNPQGPGRCGPGAGVRWERGIWCGDEPGAVSTQGCGQQRGLRETLLKVLGGWSRGRKQGTESHSTRKEQVDQQAETCLQVLGACKSVRLRPWPPRSPESGNRIQELRDKREEQSYSGLLYVWAGERSETRAI